MICPHPARPVRARGLCSACYDREWRKGTFSHPRGLNDNGLPARVMDALTTDGGWLTIEGLAVQLDASRNTVSRALYRLQARGMVESRRVVLREWIDLFTGRVQKQDRLEWRAA